MDLDQRSSWLRGGLVRGGLTIRWVKTHCTRRQILDGVVSYRDWYGNKLPDQAKRPSQRRPMRGFLTPAA